MKKDEKKEKAEALHQELEKSHTVFLSGFEGITVAQDFELRAQDRPGWGEVQGGREAASIEGALQAVC